MPPKAKLTLKILGSACGLLLLSFLGLWAWTRKHHISLRSFLSPPSVRYFDAAEAYLKEGNPSIPEVALTIDDGPHPKYLPSILRELTKGGVHATFFEVGEMMQKAPDLVRSVIAQGSEVGNHTMTHPRLDTLDGPARQAQIEECAAVFKQITGRRMMLFRPPGFRENIPILKQIKSLGYVTVGWNVGAHDYILKGDFKPQDPNLITKDVLDNVREGSIVLLHDAPGTAEALPTILAGLQEKGLKVVTATEMLAHLPKPVLLQANPKG